MPEIASRKHIEKINQVIKEALGRGGCHPDDLDAIGVTYGPGLERCPSCGRSRGQGIAYAKKLPL